MVAIKAKHWQKIKRGDTACIVAPSYGEATNKDIGPAIANAINIVQDYGLTAYMYPNAISPGNHSLFDSNHMRLANNPAVAVTQLMDAFTNKTCKLVWAYRGGYGAIALLNALSNELEPQNVKPFIGFSDLTILHIFINNIWDWPTIHFGMPGALPQIMQRNDTKQSLQNIIFTPSKQVNFTLKALNEFILENAVIKGTITGGNLYNFDKLLGTKFSPILDNSIIILEDVGEPARKIAGCLEKLQLMADFNKISAIIFATFTPTSDQEIFNKVFKNFAQFSNVAVFQLAEQDTIGHGEINNAMPFGTEASIKPIGLSYQLSVNTGGLDFSANDEL